MNILKNKESDNEVRNLPIRTILNSVYKNIQRNKYTYILYGVVIQLIMVILSNTVLKGAFKLVLISTGEQNFTEKTFFKVFTNFQSVIALVIYILTFATIIYLEWTILTLLIYSKHKKRDIQFSIKEIGRKLLIDIKHLFGYQILLFVGYILLTIPLENMGFSSELTKQLYIPDFLINEGMKMPIGIYAIPILLAIIFYLNFKLIFVFPLTAVNDEKLITNMKKSWNITSKNSNKLIVLITIFYILSSGLVLFLSTGLSSIFSYIDKGANNVILLTVFYTLINIVTFTATVFYKIGLIILSIIILEYTKDFPKEIRQYFKNKKDIETNNKSKKILIILSTIGIIGYFAITGIILEQRSLNGSVYSISHRGDIKNNVENSIGALIEANKKGATFVEMDIMQTKDKEFVVIHDKTLKRLAGKNINVADLTLEELEKIEVTDGKNKDKLVSLEKYLKEANNLNQKLLIEVKYNGTEEVSNKEKRKEFVLNLKEKLEKYNISSEHQIVSFNKDVMIELKKELPNIKMGYIISFLLGSLEKDELDFVLIEDFSYTDILALSQISENKEVYVWTVNEKEKLQKYLQSPVSGIITDELDDLNEIKKQLQENSSYQDKAKRLINNKSR